MSRPVRVLHAVGSLAEGGGVQTWLLQLLRNMDLGRFEVQVVAYHGLDSPGAQEIRELGCTVTRIPSAFRNTPGFVRGLRQALGPGACDVVHSHMIPTSGLVVKEARALEVPMRIVHSRGTRYRTAATPILRPWILRHATHLMAVSRDAAVAGFGRAVLEDPRLRFPVSGIDLTPFGADYDRMEARAELGLPADALVVGNVSRMTAGKNHRLLLEVAAELCRRNDGIRLLLVGDGPLRQEVEKGVSALGIGDRTVLAGNRADVPRLMRAAMDVFVFPSEHEGLPRVLIEAQAAGLPCVISDVMPAESDIIEPMVYRVGLSRPATEWAEATLRAAESHQALKPADCFQAVSRSGLNIANVAEQLQELYASAVADRPGSEQRLSCTEGRN